MMIVLPSSTLDFEARSKGGARYHVDGSKHTIKCSTCIECATDENGTGSPRRDATIRGEPFGRCARESIC